uniref:NADH-ubiquinone oxidoreductase chain 6 n=1 Tax=Dynatosoma fuscicorne TaxID=2339868 RepID=A0A7L7S0E3_9DIPT|nr:NADH dehydrogenase subunit 6 [Dynatosoma fuscicorne]
MFQFIINSLIMTMSILFMKLKHPLSMGMMLLTQTLLISLFIGLISKTFWFSYILFLVFLGGMLVLFIYVTSLSSNEMFETSMKLFIAMMIFLSINMFLYIFMDMNYIYNMSNNEMSLMTDFNFLIQEDCLNLMKLYNYSTNFITLFLINYLFLTLVISVKITNFFYGPLRPSM